MADPYATRAPDLSGGPVGPAPWRGLVGELGGAFIEGDGTFPADANFVVVDCRGMGTLAPIALVEPALAALLWVEHTTEARSAEAANALHARLSAVAEPIFAIKQGCVGGPSGRPGCLQIGPELIGSVLPRALAGEVHWETDPDFGYEVPAHVPGLDDEAARALLPRLRYADFDRVYEHAGLVAAKKRERAAIAGTLGGLDPAIASVAGWPPLSSPSGWRE